MPPNESDDERQRRLANERLRQRRLDDELRLDDIRRSLVNCPGARDGQTLHVAVEAMKVEVVKDILEVTHFDVNAENSSGKTALELAVEKSLDRTVSADNARNFRNIERVLLGHDKVSAFVDRLYRERQVNVDAANAILLGAALIATITFSSWFTLPLPQDTSTNAPSPQDTSTNAPSPQVPPTNARAIEVFWVLNSLSFFFSVATVLAAAYATAPIFDHPFIGVVVRIVKRKLVLTSSLFVVSVLCVLGAFTSGAYARLAKDQVKQTKIVIVAPVGIVVCSLILIAYVVELEWGTQKSEYLIRQIEKIFRCVKKIGNMILWPVFKALQALRQLILCVKGCQRRRRQIPV
jgi:hypothetical protein